MHHRVVTQCIQSLKTIEIYLDKAEQLAAKKGFDVDVLLNSRLAPDMKPLIYQVQSACDYVKGGAAWLSGQRPPKHEDTEKTIDEVRARIRKTVAFAREFLRRNTRERPAAPSLCLGSRGKSCSAMTIFSR